MKFVIHPAVALAASLIVSALLLAGAHLFEKVGGLAPCLLCLDQREAHWTALAVALAGSVIARMRLGPRALTATIGALTLVYLFSAGLAAFHAGVEWDFWDGPAGCATGGTLTLDVNSDDLLSSLNSAGPSGPPCEVAAWRFLGISMAGYNALISLALAAVTGLGALTAARKSCAEHTSGSVSPA